MRHSDQVRGRGTKEEASQVRNPGDLGRSNITHDSDAERQLRALVVGRHDVDDAGNDCAGAV